MCVLKWTNFSLTKGFYLVLFFVLEADLVTVVENVCVCILKLYGRLLCLGHTF